MRISIIGASGAGKSTLADRLARQFGLPRIELDALNWETGWRDLHGEDPDAFIARVEVATRGEGWVCDGNYTICQNVLWPRTTDIVWLDYPLSVSMPRLLGRTFKRALDGRELWAGTGNRESIGRWFDPDHPVWFTLRNHKRFTLRRAEHLANPRWAHLRLHRLRSPKDVEGLIQTLSRPIS